MTESFFDYETALVKVLHALDADNIPHLSVLPTGACYTVGDGEDFDVVVLVHDLGTAAARAETAGWEIDGEGYSIELDTFFSAKGTVIGILKDVNLLCVQDHHLYEKWGAAAEVCKALKLTNKRDRIAVHRIVLEGFDHTEAYLD